MGNMNLAVKYLQMYINTDDSLKIANEQVVQQRIRHLIKCRKAQCRKERTNAPGTGKGVA